MLLATQRTNKIVYFFDAVVKKVHKKKNRSRYCFDVEWEKGTKSNGGSGSLNVANIYLLNNESVENHSFIQFLLHELEKNQRAMEENAVYVLATLFPKQTTVDLKNP